MNNLKTIVHGLIALAVLTYVAGEFTGRFVHRLNDALAAYWRSLIVPTESILESTSEPEPEPEPEPESELNPESEPKPIVISAVWLLRESGLSQRAIAAELGITRSRVRKELAAFA